MEHPSEGRTGNKVRNYIFYAIGEVLLVMIGILLAVQVSNWNESVRESNEERFYYTKLIENLRQDTTNINNSRLSIKRQLAAIEQIIKEFKTKENEPLETDIARAILQIESYHPETATWENLKATGKINLIRSQEVVDSLSNYYNSFLLDAKQWLDANREYSRNHLGPYLMKFDDIRLDYNIGEFEEVFDPQKRSVKEYQEDVFIRNSLIFKRTTLTGLDISLQRHFDKAMINLRLLKE